VLTKLLTPDGRPKNLMPAVFSTGMKIHIDQPAWSSSSSVDAIHCFKTYQKISMELPNEMNTMTLLPCESYEDTFKRTMHSYLTAH